MGRRRLDFKNIALIGLLIFIFLLFLVIASLYENLVKQEQFLLILHLATANNDEFTENTIIYKFNLINLSSEIFISTMQSMVEEEAEERDFKREMWFIFDL